MKKEISKYICAVLLVIVTLCSCTKTPESSVITYSSYSIIDSTNHLNSNIPQKGSILIEQLEYNNRYTLSKGSKPRMVMTSIEPEKSIFEYKDEKYLIYTYKGTDESGNKCTISDVHLYIKGRSGIPSKKGRIIFINYPNMCISYNSEGK